MLDLEPYYHFAVTVARKAGKVLLDHYESDFHINYKGTGKNDLVTEIDSLAEKCAIEAIQKKYPDHEILGEESGAISSLPKNNTAKPSSKEPERELAGETSHSTRADFRWIIDPLDGTTNYAHGYPFFCVSIGLEYRGEIVIAIVYAPQLDEFFRAAKGHGAYLNNREIKVSSIKTLELALLETGFTYQKKEKNLPYFEKFLYPAQGIRRSGSAAIALAYVAAGRLEGFWEFCLKPWDVAAGKLLIEEAGGKVTNMDGTPLTLDGENILATNSHLHPEMLKLIKETAKT